jgi:hypothetical protein
MVYISSMNVLRVQSIFCFTVLYQLLYMYINWKLSSRGGGSSVGKQPPLNK